MEIEAFRQHWNELDILGRVRISVQFRTWRRKTYQTGIDELPSLYELVITADEKQDGLLREFIVFYCTQRLLGER